MLIGADRNSFLDESSGERKGREKEEAKRKKEASRTENYFRAISPRVQGRSTPRSSYPLANLEPSGRRHPSAQRIR